MWSGIAGRRIRPVAAIQLPPPLAVLPPRAKTQINRSKRQERTTNKQESKQEEEEEKGRSVPSHPSFLRSFLVFCSSLLRSFSFSTASSGYVLRSLSLSLPPLPLLLLLLLCRCLFFEVDLISSQPLRMALFQLETYPRLREPVAMERLAAYPRRSMRFQIEDGVVGVAAAVCRGGGDQARKRVFLFAMTSAAVRNGFVSCRVGCEREVSSATTCVIERQGETSMMMTAVVTGCVCVETVRSVCGR